MQACGKILADKPGIVNEDQRPQAHGGNGIGRGAHGVQRLPVTRQGQELPCRRFQQIRFTTQKHIAAAVGAPVHKVRGRSGLHLRPNAGAIFKFQHQGGIHFLRKASVDRQPAAFRRRLGTKGFSGAAGKHRRKKQQGENTLQTNPPLK